MKYINMLTTSIMLLLLAFVSTAQARGTPLDDAEARVVMQSKEAGASYKIDSARYVNHIEPADELIKYTHE
ncbi:DUF1471 domain-containing protein [Pantoea cypripedii]|uniref:DUF1471 domain-containing protein n=1 Tax=Pantoea cypripedii TaxID=55209 RepID=A0A6B9GA86_PANCY|nr:DUF1471 domain-containing protein [Pantoea cypripedii]QGY29216.1 DUF1471 domain-containing protein [Pantoea cypripedii]